MSRIESNREVMEASERSISSATVGSHIDDGEKMSDVFMDDEGSVAKTAATTTPQNSQKTTLVAIGAGTVLATLVIVLTAVCGVGHCAAVNSNSSSSTASDPKDMSHTTYNRDPAERLEIQEALAKKLGANYFDDNSTISSQGQARQMALHWFLHEDPAQLKATDSNLLQRYILHLLYFQTSRYSSWEECNPPREKEKEFCFYPKDHGYGLGGEDNPQLWGHRWLTDLHECMWAGIICDRETKDVVEISLSE